MVRMLRELPSDIHPQVTLTHVAQRYNLKGLWFLDTWPLGVPIANIIDPELATQVTQSNGLPKCDLVKDFSKHLIGERSIISADGPEWRRLRTMFNPGFTMAHLMTVVPGMIDDINTFIGLLTSRAESQNVFCLEELTTRLTIDVIGRVVMDTELHSQTSENELVNAIRSQLLWTPRSGVSISPEIVLNPIRKVVSLWYERKIDQYLKNYLEQRYASDTVESSAYRKRFIDVALDMYTRENKDAGADQMFQKTVIDK